MGMFVTRRVLRATKPRGHKARARREHKQREFVLAVLEQWASNHPKKTKETK